jgi:glycosyltransferase involved in cell wall biosynthesis
MEAALLGMPIILNERTAGLAKELLTGNFMIVEDSKSGYENGIKRLIKDDSLRERLGRGAATQAWATWDPEKMEKQIIQIYKKLANFKE